MHTREYTCTAIIAVFTCALDDAIHEGSAGLRVSVPADAYER